MPKLSYDPNTPEDEILPPTIPEETDPEYRVSELREAAQELAALYAKDQVCFFLEQTFQIANLNRTR